MEGRWRALPAGGLRSLRRAGTIAAPVPLLHILQWIPASVTAASIGYCVLATIAGVRFGRRKDEAPRANDWPSVSILKPLKGADPEMYGALRSHCVQDYPDYEVLCGVSSEDDPATPVVKKLMNEFPDRKIRLVLCKQRLGANGKVSSLIQIAAAARFECLLVNDSDICVEPDYLRTVMSELQEQGVGMVTCLYRGVPSNTLGSHIEALSIATDFAGGVLAADLLEGGVHFGLGSTLAFRKRDLEKTGGFESIVDHLADDYELGDRIAKAGLKVRLSRSVVETHLPAYDLAGFVSHQLRWARTIRASRPGGYAGLLLTFTMPWAVATLACAQAATWSWGLFGAAVVARAAMAFVTARLVLRERNLFSLLLVPVRDFIAVVVWLGGLAGSKIVWRGERFVLKRGKLIPE